MQEPGEIVFHWTVTALVWSAGFGLRTLERRAHASMRRAIDAEVGAAEQAMQAVLDERARIARELHDIVAHSVSSMVVQAGAAEAGARRPGRTCGRPSRSIRSTGNDALAEMRRLVSMLRIVRRRAAWLRSRGSQALPGAGRAHYRRRALDARLDRERRAARPLPAGLDLALYRIVQEALTNVRRHAGAAALRGVPALRGRRGERRGRRRRPRRARSAPRTPVTAWSACASGPACTAAS